MMDSEEEHAVFVVGDTKEEEEEEECAGAAASPIAIPGAIGEQHSDSGTIEDSPSQEYVSSRQLHAVQTEQAIGEVIILQRGRAFSMPNVSSMMQARAHNEIGHDLRKISDDLNMEYKDHHEKVQKAARNRRESAPASVLSSSFPGASVEDNQSLFQRLYRLLFAPTPSQPRRPARVRRYTISNLETLPDEQSENSSNEDHQDIFVHSL